jgi:GAF domain-containing protein
VAAGELAVRIIHEELAHYDWVGIYWLAGEELVLGPFHGAPTEHTRIPVGRGVCGTAVAAGANQVVRDVRELANYLACSVAVRSEIVVLIRDREGRILGQIDADGHEVGAFDASDEELLAAIARRIGRAGAGGK